MSQSKSNPSYAAGWRWGWGLLALLALWFWFTPTIDPSQTSQWGGIKQVHATLGASICKPSGAKGRKASSGRTGSMRHVPSRNLSGVSQDQSRKDLPRIGRVRGTQWLHQGEESIPITHANVAFEMIRQGKNYFQTAISKTPRGEQRTTSRIDLVLGAGGVADDVFLSWHDDGTMRELPMVWLYPLNSWSTSHFDPNSGGDYSGPHDPLFRMPQYLGQTCPGDAEPIRTRRASSGSYLRIVPWSRSASRRLPSPESKHQDRDVCRTSEQARKGATD